MKKFLFVLIFCATQTMGSKPYLEQDTYKKYLVNNSLKVILDEHSEELIDAFEKCDENVCLKKKRVYEFPWLPGYLIKKYISRIIGVETLKSCIEKNELDLIVIPKKQIYVVDGYEFIIVQKMTTRDGRHPLTLKQAQQLWTIVEQTGYNDLHRGNYLFLEDNKLAIIDTERRSFDHRRFKAYARFLISHYPSDYTEEAFKFVLEKFVRNIPDDVLNVANNIIATKGKYSYSRIYERIENNLKGESVFAWDYYSFFKEHFPTPLKVVEQ